jgi:hypothetical protein
MRRATSRSGPDRSSPRPAMRPTMGSVRFSRTDMGRNRPSPLRSSGTSATPARMASLGLRRRRGVPATLISPEVERIPNKVRNSSRCPCPASPPTPTTSPSRTLKVMSRSRVSVSPRTASIVRWPGSRCPPWLRTGARPVISWTASSSVSWAAVDTWLPPRNTVIRSASALTSRHRWEVKMTQVPARHSPRTRPNSQATSRSASEDVGSSSNSTFGCWLTARTISTTCRCARGRVSTSAPGSIEVTPCSASTCRARAVSAPRRIKRSAPRGSRPSNRFSATDRYGSRVSSWNAVTMPRSAASDGPFSTTGWLSTRNVPASGWTTPQSSLISVLLPAPFSPTRACTSPAEAAKLACRSAWIGPNRLSTSVASITGRPASVSSAVAAVTPALRAVGRPGAGRTVRR